MKNHLRESLSARKPHAGSRSILLLLALLFFNSAWGDGGIHQWEWLGPGNAGGIVRSLVIHPTNNPLHILAASPGGGIWRSTNSGASWYLTDGWLPNLVVSTLSMCDSNPSVVYAGTGESFGNRNPSPSFGRGAPGAGIYKSTNSGVSWDRLASTEGWATNENRFVNFVAVHPTDPDLVLAATDAGVQRSTNGGATWQNPLTWTGRVTEVRWVGASGNAVAGLGPINTPALATDLVCALFSANSGQSWTASTFVGIPGSNHLANAATMGTNSIVVASALDFAALDYINIGSGSTEEVRRIASIGTGGGLRLTGNLLYDHSAGEPVILRISQRTALAVTPDAARVYASMGAGDGTVWRSEDQGMTFNFLSNPTADYTRSWRAYYNNVIWAAPRPAPNQAQDLVVVAGGEAYRSIDSGTNFTRISRYIYFNEGLSAHSDMHAIAPDPRYPLVHSVYFGDDGGVQAATDILTVTETTGWTNLAHDLGLSQLWASTVTPDGQWFFGGGQDLGPVIRGPGDGINDWFLWTDAADSRGGAVEANPPGGEPFNFYNATSNLQRITNNVPGAGATLTDAAGKLLSWAYRAVTIDPNNPAVILAAGTEIWRNTNRGDSNAWTVISSAHSSLCNVVEVAPGNSSDIWAGYGDGRVTRTTDLGTNWTDMIVSGTITNCASGVITQACAVSDILIDPNDPQHVFVTFLGYQYDFRLTCPLTVFVTTNGGQCWMPLMGTPPYELPPTIATSIAMHPSNPNWLYVGTDRGVYASENSGQTWALTPAFDQHEGPYNVMIRDLDWHDPDYLVAATYGLGMYRARVPVNVYVDGSYVGAELGTLAQPFNTVRKGDDLIGNGANLWISAGDYDETGTVQFDQRGYIRSTGGIVTIR